MHNFAHFVHMDLHNERHEKRVAEAEQHRLAKSQTKTANRALSDLGLKLVRFGKRLQATHSDDLEQFALVERMAQ